MKKWCTEIFAKHNVHGEMRKFIGPLIEAPTAELARQWCIENAGWLHVTGNECVAVVDAKTGECEDFETTQNN